MPSLRAAFQALPRPAAGTVRLLLVRHGESESNKKGLIGGGANDAALTEVGAAQAERFASELAATLDAVGGFTISLVGSSGLRRAVTTADAIARRFPAAKRLQLHALREMEYGELEGRRIVEVQPRLIEISTAWRAGRVEQRVGAGGESPQEVLQRMNAAVTGALRDLERNPAADGGATCRVAVLVAHAHANKVLLAASSPQLGLARLHDVPQRNCAVNILDVVHHGALDGAEHRSRRRGCDGGGAASWRSAVDSRLPRSRASSKISPKT